MIFGLGHKNSDFSNKERAKKEKETQKKEILVQRLAFPENSLSLTRFLKHLIIDMPHIFGNMDYLNIKERDRF